MDISEFHVLDAWGDVEEVGDKNRKKTIARSSKNHSSDSDRRRKHSPESDRRRNRSRDSNTPTRDEHIRKSSPLTSNSRKYSSWNRSIPSKSNDSHNRNYSPGSHHTQRDGRERGPTLDQKRYSSHRGHRSVSPVRKVSPLCIKHPDSGSRYRGSSYRKGTYDSRQRTYSTTRSSGSVSTIKKETDNSEKEISSRRHSLDSSPCDKASLSSLSLSPLLSSPERDRICDDNVSVTSSPARPINWSPIRSRKRHRSHSSSKSLSLSPDNNQRKRSPLPRSFDHVGRHQRREFVDYHEPVENTSWLTGSRSESDWEEQHIRSDSPPKIFYRDPSDSPPKIFYRDRSDSPPKKFYRDRSDSPPKKFYHDRSDSPFKKFYHDRLNSPSKNFYHDHSDSPPKKFYQDQYKSPHASDSNAYHQKEMALVPIQQLPHPSERPPQNLYRNQYQVSPAPRAYNYPQHNVPSSRVLVEIPKVEVVPCKPPKQKSVPNVPSRVLAEIPKAETIPCKPPKQKSMPNVPPRVLSEIPKAETTSCEPPKQESETKIEPVQVSSAASTANKPSEVQNPPQKKQPEKTATCDAPYTTMVPNPVVLKNCEDALEALDDGRHPLFAIAKGFVLHLVAAENSKPAETSGTITSSAPANQLPPVATQQPPSKPPLKSILKKSRNSSPLQSILRKAVNNPQQITLGGLQLKQQNTIFNAYAPSVTIKSTVLAPSAVTKECPSCISQNQIVKHVETQVESLKDVASIQVYMTQGSLTDIKPLTVPQGSKQCELENRAVKDLDSRLTEKASFSHPKTNELAPPSNLHSVLHGPPVRYPTNTPLNSYPANPPTSYGYVSYPNTSLYSSRPRGGVATTGSRMPHQIIPPRESSFRYPAQSPYSHTANFSPPVREPIRAQHNTMSPVQYPTPIGMRSQAPRMQYGYPNRGQFHGRFA